MELALERTELPQSALYVRKARLNELAGPGARALTASPDLEELADFLQVEVKPLGSLEEGEVLDDVGAVQAVPLRGATQGRNQPPFLIEAKSANRDAALPGQHTNRHAVARSHGLLPDQPRQRINPPP